MIEGGENLSMLFDRGLDYIHNSFNTSEGVVNRQQLSPYIHWHFNINDFYWKKNPIRMSIVEKFILNRGFSTSSF